MRPSHGAARSATRPTCASQNVTRRRYVPSSWLVLDLVIQNLTNTLFAFWWEVLENAVFSEHHSFGHVTQQRENAFVLRKPFYLDRTVGSNLMG